MKLSKSWTQERALSPTDVLHPAWSSPSSSPFELSPSFAFCLASSQNPDTLNYEQVLHIGASRLLSQHCALNVAVVG